VVAAVLLGVLAYCVPGSSGVDPHSARTVLLVVLDAARADRTTLADPMLATTPNLARLAERGLVFDAHACASDGANAALASILTGREPRAHGVGDLTVAGRQRLRADVGTLAEVLRADGFATWGAVALPQLDADLSGLARGFDHWYAPALGTETGGTPSSELLDAHLPELDDLLREEADVFVLAFLADARDPFALPATARARFLRGRLAPLATGEPEVAAAIGQLDSDPAGALASLDEAFRRRRGHPVFRALDQASYDAALFAADAGLGRLVDLLATRGRLERACIVVVGARGREPGRDSGAPPGDATLRTPWVLRPPGGITAQHSGFESHAIDVAPSLLAALGLADRLGPVDGAALFTDGAPRPPSTDRIVVFESVQDGSLVVFGHGVRAWSGAPGDVQDSAVAAALAVRSVGASGTELIAVHGGPVSLTAGLRAVKGDLAAVVVGPDGERAPKRVGGELRLELTRDADRAIERLSVRGAGIAAPLRLSVSATAGAVEERVWIGATPLERAALPRIADRRAGDWPTRHDGGPHPWTVDIERVRGTTFRISIVPTAAGDRVEVLVATYPPRNPVEALEVRVDEGADAPEILPVAGRPDFARVHGNAPCSFLVERRASESLALAIAVGGRQVPLAAIRLEGRRYARPGTLELYLPAPSTGLFDLYGADPAPDSVPPGTLIVRRSGEASAADGLSVEQWRFVRRLGGRQ